MPIRARSTSRLAAAFAVLTLFAPVSGAASPRIDPVYDVLGLGEMLEIMREEGIGYGADLEQELFPGRGGDVWAGAVGAIYDTDRMETAIQAELDRRLGDGEIAAILDFFGTETGARIIGYEIAARRALLDDAVEETASEDWQQLEADGDALWDQLVAFAEINDLVESNVAGALTSNYAFYTGLIDGGAFSFEMTEDQVLADVWSQEDSIREETVDWVYSFGALAYQPLSEAEFREYIDFAGTDAGQALNAALFAAFNDLFAGISRELGFGAARYVAGQDI